MIGLHVKKNNCRSYDSSYKEYKKKFNIETAQAFTHGPASSRCNNIDRVSCKNLYIHSAYLTMGLWSGKCKNLIESEIREAERLLAAGLIIHIKNIDSEEIIKICKNLYKTYEFVVPIILETPATNSKFNNNYSQLSNLTKLLPLTKFNFQFCVDTAHLWAAGVDVTDFQLTAKWLDTMGESIKLIHLNSNSKDNFGKGRDVHVIPFSASDGIWYPKYGDCVFDILPQLKQTNANVSEIWNLMSAENKARLRQSGFAAVVNFAKKNSIDCIGEVNRGSDEDTLVFINLYKLLRYSYR